MICGAHSGRLLRPAVTYGDGYSKYGDGYPELVGLGAPIGAQC
jgi:hypothetical protein